MFDFLDKGKFACRFFVNLQKAFNVDNHEILLSKRDYCGICGVTNKCFETYISKRSMC